MCSCQSSVARVVLVCLADCTQLLVGKLGSCILFAVNFCLSVLFHHPWYSFHTTLRTKTLPHPPSIFFLQNTHTNTHIKKCFHACAMFEVPTSRFISSWPMVHPQTGCCSFSTKRDSKDNYVNYVGTVFSSYKCCFNRLLKLSSCVT